MKPQRGVALLLVLWLLALLTALIGAFAVAARVEALQGRVLSDGSIGQQVARAGMEYALQRVADGDARSHWAADGRQYQWTFDGVPVQVRIYDESGKVDLNQTDPQTLTNLLQAVGVEAAQARQLAGAVIDWRDPDALIQPGGGAEDPDYAEAGLAWGAKDAPFESVAEVEQVLGWTPQIYAKLAPYLTIYGGRGRPDPAYAQGPVLTALGMDAALALAQRERMANGPALVAPGSGTYSIQSRALLPRGGQAVLQAVVRAGGGPLPGSAYTTLHWEEGWERR